MNKRTLSLFVILVLFYGCSNDHDSSPETPDTDNETSNCGMIQEGKKACLNGDVYQCTEGHLVIVTECDERQYCDSDTLTCKDIPAENCVITYTEDSNERTITLVPGESKCAVSSMYTCSTTGTVSSQPCPDKTPICDESGTKCRSYKACGNVEDGQQACFNDNVYTCHDGSLILDAECGENQYCEKNTFTCVDIPSDSCTIHYQDGDLELTQTIAPGENKCLNAVVYTCNEESSTLSTLTCPDETPICDETGTKCRSYKGCGNVEDGQQACFNDNIYTCHDGSLILDTECGEKQYCEKNTLTCVDIPPDSCTIHYQDGDLARTQTIVSGEHKCLSGVMYTCNDGSPTSETCSTEVRFATPVCSDDELSCTIQCKDGLVVKTVEGAQVCDCPDDYIYQSTRDLCLEICSTPGAYRCDKNNPKQVQQCLETETVGIYAWQNTITCAADATPGVEESVCNADTGACDTVCRWGFKYSDDAHSSCTFRDSLCNKEDILCASSSMFYTCTDEGVWSTELTAITHPSILECHNGEIACINDGYSCSADGKELHYCNIDGSISYYDFSINQNLYYRIESCEISNQYSCTSVNDSFGCYQSCTEENANSNVCNNNNIYLSYSAQCIKDDNDNLVNVPDTMHYTFCGRAGCDFKTGSCIKSELHGQSCKTEGFVCDPDNEALVLYCDTQTYQLQYSCKERYNNNDYVCSTIDSSTDCRKNCHVEGETTYYCNGSYSMTSTCTKDDNGRLVMHRVDFTPFEYCEFGCNEDTGKCNTGITKDKLSCTDQKEMKCLQDGYEGCAAIGDEGVCYISKCDNEGELTYSCIDDSLYRFWTKYDVCTKDNNGNLVNIHGDYKMCSNSVCSFKTGQCTNSSLFETDCTDVGHNICDPDNNDLLLLCSYYGREFNDMTSCSRYGSDYVCMSLNDDEDSDCYRQCTSTPEPSYTCKTDTETHEEYSIKEICTKDAEDNETNHQIKSSCQFGCNSATGQCVSGIDSDGKSCTTAANEYCKTHGHAGCAVFDGAADCYDAECSEEKSTATCLDSDTFEMSECKTADDGKLYEITNIAACLCNTQTDSCSWGCSESEIKRCLEAGNAGCTLLKGNAECYQTTCTESDNIFSCQDSDTRTKTSCFTDDYGNMLASERNTICKDSCDDDTTSESYGYCVEDKPCVVACGEGYLSEGDYKCVKYPLPCGYGCTHSWYYSKGKYGSYTYDCQEADQY